MSNENQNRKGEKPDKESIYDASKKLKETREKDDEAMNRNNPTKFKETAVHKDNSQSSQQSLIHTPKTDFDKTSQEDPFTKNKTELKNETKRDNSSVQKNGILPDKTSFLQKNVSEKHKQEPLGKWKIISHSVKGKSHIRSKTPCQDSTFKLEDTKEDFYGLALADGAGSCQHSKEGAELITKEILSHIKKQFDKIHNIEKLNSLDIQEIIEYWENDSSRTKDDLETLKISNLFFIYIKEDLKNIFNRNKIYNEIKNLFIEDIKKEFDKKLAINQPSDNEIKKSFIDNIERNFTEIFNIKKLDLLIDTITKKTEKEFDKDFIDESSCDQIKTKYLSVIKHNFDKIFSIEEEKHKRINDSFLENIRKEQKNIFDKIKNKHSNIKKSLIDNIDSELNEISPNYNRLMIEEKEICIKVEQKLEKVGENLKKNYEDYKKQFLMYTYEEYKNIPFNKKTVPNLVEEEKWKQTFFDINKTYKETTKQNITHSVKKEREKLEEKIKFFNSNWLDEIFEYLRKGWIKKANQDSNINEYYRKTIISIEKIIDNEKENFRTQTDKTFNDMSHTIDKNCKKLETPFVQEIEQKLNQVFNSKRISNEFEKFFLNYIEKEFNKIFKIDRSYNKFREKFLLKHIEEKLESHAIDKEYKLKDLSSTLLFVVVKKKQCIFGHIGDGVIGQLDNQGNLQVISFPENGEYANSTFFTTSTDYKDRLRIKTGTLTKTTGFILMSDGAGEGLYDTRKKTLGTINKKIINYLKDNDSDKAKELLEQDLNRIKSKKTTDDCSIGIMRMRE